MTLKWLLTLCLTIFFSVMFAVVYFAWANHELVTAQERESSYHEYQRRAEQCALLWPHMEHRYEACLLGRNSYGQLRTDI